MTMIRTTVRILPYFVTSRNHPEFVLNNYIIVSVVYREFSAIKFIYM